MPYKDKAAQTRYQREWVAKRRKEWLDKNGPCVKCGRNDKLQVDHIDPRLKTTHKIWSWSETKRLEELKKCQVLCEKCHKKKTIEHRFPKHGTAARYRRKCRCAACKEAHRLAVADWRAGR
jgi:5-methylcytosine-specific restriction endonuclease McrA